jgi:hypothetical protein
MPVYLLDCSTESDPFTTTVAVTLRATVYEVGGVPPTSIIHDNQPWYVDVEWTVASPLLHHLCGTWRLSVVLESIGPGDDYEFPVPIASVPIDPCGTGTYTYRINVAAGAVAARDPDGTLYIVGVTLNSLDACGHAGHIHAYCTGEELHFVPSHP